MTEPLHMVRFSGESEEYRRAREELLEAEIDLRRRTGAVAAKRRALPLGGPVPEDYCFEEVAEGGGEVRFSELFGEGRDTLVVYSFMFPRWSGDTRCSRRVVISRVGSSRGIELGCTDLTSGEPVGV
ncbi:MAG TPA: DUF899 family protein [Solirubrobacteraceae bacterium]